MSEPKYLLKLLREAWYKGHQLRIPFDGYSKPLGDVSPLMVSVKSAHSNAVPRHTELS